jgi:serine/threonine protein kinase
MDAGSMTLVVRDRWQCESRIATLPTNTVWRAHDLLLDRPVAVRIFHKELLVDPVSRRRLEQAFVVAARLEHDNISCVYDAFDDELGVVLISELVEGPTLREVADRLGSVHDEAVCAIGVQLAQGVAAAATSGLAHRELTPNHVRITHDGTVKILGLGSARLLDDDAATPMVGGDVDTSYLAPEQLGGSRSDHRTDIYSLGLMLWELATGTRPFAGDLDRRRREDIPPLRVVRPGVRSALSDAVERATRLEAAARWEDARDLAADLQRACAARPKRIVHDLTEELLPDPPAPIATLRSRADVASDAPPDPDHRDGRSDPSDDRAGGRP